MNVINYVLNGTLNIMIHKQNDVADKINDKIPIINKNFIRNTSVSIDSKNNLPLSETNRVFILPMLLHLLSGETELLTQ